MASIDNSVSPPRCMVYLIKAQLVTNAVTHTAALRIHRLFSLVTFFTLSRGFASYCWLVGQGLTSHSTHLSHFGDGGVTAASARIVATVCASYCVKMTVILNERRVFCRGEGRSHLSPFSISILTVSFLGALFKTFAKFLLVGAKG